MAVTTPAMLHAELLQSLTSYSSSIPLGSDVAKAPRQYTRQNHRINESSPLDLIEDVNEITIQGKEGKLEVFAELSYPNIDVRCVFWDVLGDKTSALRCLLVRIEINTIT